MLWDYILKENTNSEESICAFESNADEKTLKSMINDFRKTVKRPTCKGLYRYVRRMGYIVTDLLIVFNEEAAIVIEISALPSCHRVQAAAILRK
jgi:hypothetical protein